MATSQIEALQQRVDLLEAVVIRLCNATGVEPIAPPVEHRPVIVDLGGTANG